MKVTVTQFVLALILAAITSLVIMFDEKKVGRKFAARPFAFLLLYLVPWWTGAIVYAMCCWRWISVGVLVSNGRP